MGPYSPEPCLRKVRTLGAEGAVLFAERSSVDDSMLPTTYARTTAISKVRELSGGTAVVFIGKSAIHGHTAEVGPWIATCPCSLQFKYAAAIVGLDLTSRSLWRRAPGILSSEKKVLGVSRDNPRTHSSEPGSTNSRCQNPVVSRRRVDRKENAKR